MKKQYMIPIFIPYVNDYVFGNSGNSKKKITKEEVKKIIDKHQKEIEENSKVEIAFLGEDFSKLEEKNQNELLETAYSYIKEKKADSIRISAKPNRINKKFIKKLKKFKVKTIELEVKSVNDYILKRSEAGYTFEDIKKASRLIRFNKITLAYQIFIGLPESTHLDEINTTKKLVKLKPKMVKLYPILVMKNTKIEKDYINKKYKALTEIQAIETCKEMVKLFAKKNIEVIRIGIQSTDINLKPEEFKKQLVDGPFNDNFRQLVESGIWYDVVVEKIKKLNAKVKEVVIEVNPIDVENVVGQNKNNIKILKDTYDVDLIVKSEEKIKQGKSRIEITKFYEDFSE